MISFKVYKKISKGGNEYFQLVCDLGYVVKVVTYDTELICEMLDITKKELHSMIIKEMPTQLLFESPTIYFERMVNAE